MANENSITGGPGGTMFAGPKGVNTFRATVIASALRLYARTGMKANAAYTPTNMLAVATEITGNTYKRNKDEYLRAAEDLNAWARKTADEIQQAAYATAPHNNHTKG